jgi:hypothetical protein
MFYTKVRKHVVLLGVFVFSALFIGAGCTASVEDTVVEEPATEAPVADVTEQAPTPEVMKEKEIVVKQQTVKNKVYTSSDHLLRFTYPETHKVVPQVFPYSAEIEIYRLAGNHHVATINISTLEASDWELPAYQDVNNSTPAFQGVEEVGGEGWNSYLLTNNNDQLFNIGCRQADCSWVLKGISFDRVPLSTLSGDSFVGAWEGYSNAEELNLNRDGTMSSFLGGHPFEEGTWTFTDGVITVRNLDGELILSSAVNEEYGILYLPDADQAWTPIN